jgi:hypothetical protein
MNQPYTALELRRKAERRADEIRAMALALNCSLAIASVAVSMKYGYTPRLQSKLHRLAEARQM